MYYTFEQFKEAFIDELKQVNAVDGDGRRIMDNDKPYLKILGWSKKRLDMFKKGSIQLIADERQRQVEVEGWSEHHDDKHTDGSLALVAASYAVAEDQRENYKDFTPPSFWPDTWDNNWFKPTPNDRIRELVKAGALIAAEIERLQRLEKQKEGRWQSK